MPDAATLTQILSQDPSGLPIPNSRLRVSQLRLQLGLEALITAPGLRVRWWQMQVPAVAVVDLLIDGDGDGVADPQDVFPGDSTEWATRRRRSGDNAVLPLNAAWGRNTARRDCP